MPTGLQYTTDLDLAAACGTLGARIQIKKGQTMGRGTPHSWKEFELHSLTMPKFMMPEEGKPEKLKERTLLHALKTGWLKENEPAHPACDIMGAFAIRAALIDWLRNGQKSARLSRHDPACDRYDLVMPSDPQAIRAAPGGDMIRTGDLKMVCGLLRLGAALLAIQGTSPRCSFTLGALSYGAEPWNVAHALKAYREKSLAPEHPLCVLMLAFANRERLLDALNGRSEQLLIRDAFSRKQQLISADADAGAWDAAARFFAIPRGV